MSRRVRAIAVSAVCSVACSLLVSSSTSAQAASTFNRIATFEVTSNPGSAVPGRSWRPPTGGRSLIYSDAEAGLIGFVANIGDPAAPAAAGVLATGGSPTSVAVTVGRYAGGGRRHSDRRRRHVRAPRRPAPRGRHPHQDHRPDAEHGWTARLGQGRSRAAGTWWLRSRTSGTRTSPTASCPTSPPTGPSANEPGLRPHRRPGGCAGGLDHQEREPARAWPGMKFPEDPEPEFVDINVANLAAVTMQENNHLVRHRAQLGADRATATGAPAASTGRSPTLWSADPSDIVFDTARISVPREPDAIGVGPGRQACRHRRRGGLRGRLPLVHALRSQHPGGGRVGPGTGGAKRSPRALRGEQVGEQGRRARGSRRRAVGGRSWRSSGPRGRIGGRLPPRGRHDRRSSNSCPPACRLRASSR